MNKRWKYNKNINKYELYFIQFYKEELIVTLWVDEEYSTCYSFLFENENYSENFEWFNSLEEAKEYIEEKYIQIMEEQIDYLKDKIDRFKEE